MRTVTGSIHLTTESTASRVFLRPDEAATLVSYDSLPVMWQRPLADQDVDETFFQSVEWIDNNMGNAAPYTIWPIPFINGSRYYKVNRPADMDYWRKLLDYTKGRQNPFLLPTYRNDLPLFELPLLGASIIKTDITDYVGLYQQDTYKRLQIETANGIVYRKAISVSDDGSGVLEISLDEPLGSEVGDNTIIKVSYLNVCRLDNDTVVLDHRHYETFIRLDIRTINE